MDLNGWVVQDPRLAGSIQVRRDYGDDLIANGAWPRARATTWRGLAEIALGKGFVMSPAAGWYPDPEQAGQLRYWDGTAWTTHRSPAQAQQPATAPPAPAEAAKPKVPLFGSRAHARETAQELEKTRRELVAPRVDMQRIGAMDVVDLAKERDELRASLAQEPTIGRSSRGKRRRSARNESASVKSGRCRPRSSANARS